jgi:phosphoglycerate kinase
MQKIQFNSIRTFNLQGRNLFIRTDMNVPLDSHGRIVDDTRILAGLPTIRYALEQGANIILSTHLGRPVEGVCDSKDSVEPIAAFLSNLLNTPVLMHTDLQPVNFTNSRIYMLQNVRCNVGEKINDSELAKTYANMCDIFVHDAFATAHRKEASTYGIAQYISNVCAGLLMEKELHALLQITQQPSLPITAIVGGAKVSSKLHVLRNLAKYVDNLILGGGILNTFLVAAGYNVGKSLYDAELVDEAREIMQDFYAIHQRNILLPQQVLVAKEFADRPGKLKSLPAIEVDDIIMDTGSEFVERMSVFLHSGTVIWNGPLGVFEFDNFAHGTRDMSRYITHSKAFVLAGGGDTIAAINKLGIADSISYISTAGGALLEFLAGYNLPGIDAMSDHYGKTI